MDVLLLHLEAPLVSFGTTHVDQVGPTGRFPTTSQITGLLGNALGYEYSDGDLLQALQDRLSIASAVLLDGEEIEDYQTVDLGQPHLREPSWTTHGRTEHRGGSNAAKYGTHIRRRRYLADASVVSAAALSPADEEPTIQNAAAALAAPARPLFIGRKPCLPSTPVLIGIVEGMSSLTEALSLIPASFPERWAEMSPDPRATSLQAEWPASDQLTPGFRAQTFQVSDLKDWSDLLHGGERTVQRGRIELNYGPGPAAGGGS